MGTRFQWYVGSSQDTGIRDIIVNIFVCLNTTVLSALHKVKYIYIYKIIYINVYYTHTHSH